MPADIGAGAAEIFLYRVQGYSGLLLILNVAWNPFALYSVCQRCSRKKKLWGACVINK